MRRGVIAEASRSPVTPRLSWAAVLRGRTALLLAVLAALAIPVLGPAAAAGADKLPKDVQAVVDDFRADGTITPCKHTVAALERTSSTCGANEAGTTPSATPAPGASATPAAGAGAGVAPAATATPQATPAAT